MGLTLLAGPANAGKVELLLDRYLAALDQDPVLIVPNRPDVDWAERELLRRSPALLGGSITTFDGVFERIAGGDPNTRPVAAEVQQTLALRAAVAKTALNGLGESARSAGFAEALRDAIGEVEGRSPVSTPRTGTSSTGSGCGTGTSSGRRPHTGWRTTSAPGTGTRSSRTASRT
jgi:hypothetical protein